MGAAAGLTDADHLAIAAAIGRPLAAPPSRTGDVLAVAIQTLRVVEDPLAFDTIALLADELASVAEELASVRLIRSEALALAYRQHVALERRARGTEAR